MYRSLAAGSEPSAARVTCMRVVARPRASYRNCSVNKSAPLCVVSEEMMRPVVSRLCDQIESVVVTTRRARVPEAQTGESRRTDDPSNGPNHIFRTAVILTANPPWIGQRRSAAVDQPPLPPNEPYARNAVHPVETEFASAQQGLVCRGCHLPGTATGGQPPALTTSRQLRPAHRSLACLRRCVCQLPAQTIASAAATQ